VHVSVLALGDRLHHLADVHTVLDDGVAHRQVLQRDLVAEGYVLHAGQRDGAIFVEDEAGQRRPGLDAFDDDDRDRIGRIVQYAMDHRECSGKGFAQEAI